jgi:short subunit fatty acids transporter
MSENSQREGSLRGSKIFQEISAIDNDSDCGSYPVSSKLSSSMSLPVTQLSNLQKQITKRSNSATLTTIDGVVRNTYSRFSTSDPNDSSSISQATATGNNGMSSDSNILRSPQLSVSTSIYSHFSNVVNSTPFTSAHRGHFSQNDLPSNAPPLSLSSVSNQIHTEGIPISNLSHELMTLLHEYNLIHIKEILIQQRIDDISILSELQETDIIDLHVLIGDRVRLRTLQKHIKSMNIGCGS